MRKCFAHGAAATLFFAFICVGASPEPAWAATKKKPAVSGGVRASGKAAPARRRPAPVVLASAGHAEAALIDVYRHVAFGKTTEALKRAESLVAQYPNFALAQLVYGDLLSARVRPVTRLGDVPDAMARQAGDTLAELREESALRLKALTERPAPGSIPTQLLQLSPRNKHVIAVDASRARLYLFENTALGLRLVADHYVSLGKAGVNKAVEGDARTPLGVYFVTSTLNPSKLKDFYGSGALPINYPNPVDLRQGRTGGGIWLHGTPPEQFSRAPRATDGCIVLSNPDLAWLARTVEIRTTPVVVAPSLQWVQPKALDLDRAEFQRALAKWVADKSGGQIAPLLSWYTTDFKNFDKTLPQYAVQLQKEVNQAAGRTIELKDLSFLQWRDLKAHSMVVTFGEVLADQATGPVKRQYWLKTPQGWKIVFEGVIS